MWAILLPRVKTHGYDVGRAYWHFIRNPEASLKILKAGDEKLLSGGKDGVKLTVIGVWGKVLSFIAKPDQWWHEKSIKRFGRSLATHIVGTRSRPVRRDALAARVSAYGIDGLNLEMPYSVPLTQVALWPSEFSTYGMDCWISERNTRPRLLRWRTGLGPTVRGGQPTDWSRPPYGRG